jgi:ABC-type glycerol-3-phosphate transport system substrate-binding protein
MKRKNAGLVVVLLLAAAPMLLMAGGRQAAGTVGTVNKSLTLVTNPAGAPFPDGVSIMNSEFFNAIQEKTGFTLDWQLLKAGESLDEQINLLIASGNPPDMIQGASKTLVSTYAFQGGLAPLDDALAHAPTLSKYYTKEALDYARINGKLYALPQTATTDVGTTNLAVRKDWLRELGLPEPKNLDELYETLKAVKRAKPNAVPLVVNGFDRFASILGAFGILTDRTPTYVVENGKVVFPYFDDRCVEFIRYMNRLYVEGLIDREFLVDKEALQKVIAGNGFMMDINYVEIIRQMPAFKEKNPSGVLEYFTPPVGPKGASGILFDSSVYIHSGGGWIVPASKQGKANLVLEFLDKANSSQELLDLIAVGVPGRDSVKNPDGTYTRLENFSKVSGTKGYYSRLDLTGTYGRINNLLEGFNVPLDYIAKTAHTNDILYASIDVPADSALIPAIKQVIIDDILNMIINGYTDAAFNKMKQDFANAGGNKVLEQYQAWYDKR